MKKIWYLLSVVLAVFVLASCEVTSNVNVTFDTLGGTTIEKITLEKGSVLDRPSNPTKSGFDFVNWWDNSEYSGEAYDFTSTVETSFTLYAKWISSSVDPTDPGTEPIVNFSVTFNTMGGTNIDSQSVTSGSKAVKPANNPTKTGYTFQKWVTTSNGTVEFDFNQAITENTIIYASWTEIVVEPTKYTVTFNANGGMTDVSSVVITDGEAVGTLPTPTRNGYTFNGWYTDSSFVTEFTKDSIVDKAYSLIASWTEIVVDPTPDPTPDSDGITSSGYAEGLYASWADTNASGATVSYQAVGASSWTSVDEELIRNTSSTTSRVDIIGLEAGNYNVKITTSSGDVKTKSNIIVSADDRSGYAHFNYSKGVGAYNDNGTLKSNATVVYVTDENKNTVKATINGKSVTGLANILAASTSESAAVDIRILGSIKTAQWNPINYSGDPAALGGILMNGTKITASNTNASELISGGVNSYSIDLAAGITTLDGLDSRLKYSGGVYDSYWNMLNVSNARNVTVEGIGTDAEIFQWGFTWKSSSYIEVKNLTFSDYTEDACSFEGPSADNSSTLAGFTTGHNWLHGCTFNIGKNNWDVSDEQDKHEGDGGVDLKYNANTTISYNRFYKTHKTGLVGGSDSAKTANVTFHHNFYDQCQSRLPFARQANMHMYNNYYYKSSGTNMQIYAGAYALVEGCYFESVKNPMSLDDRGLGTPAVKLYNNILIGCSGTNGGTVVTSRTQTVANDNLYGPTFDTDSSLFYYDSINKVSAVSYLTDAEQAKADCIAYSGVLKDIENIEVPGGTPVTKYSVSFDTDGGNTLDSILVKENSTFTPVIPTKSGYVFLGWYLDQAKTIAYTSTYTVMGDITLYASWRERTVDDITEEMYTADSNKTAEYSGTAFNTIFSNATVATDYSQAVANDDSGFVFTTAALAGGSTGVMNITAKENGTLTIYFTVSDSGFTTKDQSKSGELSIDGVSVETVSGNKDNKKAYAYTFNCVAGTTYEIGTTANRLVVFGIVYNG